MNRNLFDGLARLFGCNWITKEVTNSCRSGCLNGIGKCRNSLPKGFVCLYGIEYICKQKIKILYIVYTVVKINIAKRK